MTWALGNGDVSSRIENSGGQLRKRISFTKDCNTRRKRRRGRRKVRMILAATEVLLI
jgi:uncharacterized protein YfaP (DUF2135 family)